MTQNKSSNSQFLWVLFLTEFQGKDVSLYPRWSDCAKVSTDSIGEKKTGLILKPDRVVLLLENL